MSALLFLAHRLPYPPNKGDKVRSYHLLRHLAQRHDVFVGTFLDDPADRAHVESLRPLCAGLHVERLYPAVARLRSLEGLATGEALTVPYYRSAALQAWVDATIAAQGIDTAVLFSSPMVQYVERHQRLRRLIDFVDVDSHKWTQYSSSRPWPMSWLYRREGSRLLAFEANAAMHADCSFFVTDAEVDLFRRLAPLASGRVECVGNGVDASYFAPERNYASPYSAAEVPVVFTGAMDYWPNVDAVSWFVANVLPKLLKRNPATRFYIVGMRPTAPVRALAGPAVTVTGTVPDIRPYLAHAKVVVAPLRVARGIQNKVLEAMAMGRAVVVSDACAGGIDGRGGRDFAVAAEAGDFASRVDELVRNQPAAAAMGEAARRCVLAKYSWEARLDKFERHVGAREPTLAVPA